MIPDTLPFLGRPQSFHGESGETMTFGTFEPDPLCVLVAWRGKDGQRFACLIGDEVEVALLALLCDRDRARRRVGIASEGGTS